MSDIRLESVSIYYRNKKEIVTAVDEISLTFHTHKSNVLIGFSGCGKSSILNAISGYILFDGDIYLDDKYYDLISKTPAYFNLSSLMFHTFFLLLDNA